MEIIKPHKEKSQIVEKYELPTVIEAAKEMIKLLNTPMGMYNRHYSISHPQVDNKNPRRFFVLNSLVEKIARDESLKENRGQNRVWEIIINPVIVRHSRNTVEEKEGCMTFIDMPMIPVERFYKIEVEYNYLIIGDDGSPIFSERKKSSLKGMMARIFQHEIDHFECKYIYDI